MPWRRNGPGQQQSCYLAHYPGKFRVQHQECRNGAWYLILEETGQNTHGWPSSKPDRIAHNLAAHSRAAHNTAAQRCAGSVVCNISRQHCRLAQRWPNVGTIVPTFPPGNMPNSLFFEARDISYWYNITTSLDHRNVSNHCQLDCFFNGLFRLTIKKKKQPNSPLWALCEGMTGGFRTRSQWCGRPFHSMETSRHIKL